MLRTMIVAALLVPLAFVPNAAAHACPPHVEDAIDVGALTGGEQSYYVTQTPGVWEESNRVPGLQETDGSCTSDNGRDYEWVADTQVF